MEIEGGRAKERRTESESGATATAAAAMNGGSGMANGGDRCSSRSNNSGLAAAAAAAATAAAAGAGTGTGTGTGTATVTAGRGTAGSAADASAGCKSNGGDFGRNCVGVSGGTDVVAAGAGCRYDRREEELGDGDGDGDGYGEDEMVATERELAEDAQWKRIQQNTFTRWANEHLKTVNKNIGNLETDLSDGLRLISLIQVLAGKHLPKHNQRPTFRSQKLENVSVALKFLDDQGIKLVNIGK